MSKSPLDATTFVQRLALAGTVRLSERGETPAHAGEITRECARCADAVDADAVGRPGEAAVSRALNELDAAGLVETADAGERSPIGKGRPAYEPAPDPGTVADAFDDDDRFDGVLDG